MTEFQSAEVLERSFGVNEDIKTLRPIPPQARVVKPWRFWLGRIDPLTNQLSFVGEFTQARNKSIALILNQPGTCSFNLSMTDPLAFEISPVETCIICIRDGQIKWSGPVWTIRESLPENSIEVNAIGWFEFLNHRFIRPDFLTQDLIFEDKYDGEIATTLIETVAQIFPLPITVVGYEPNQIRNYKYERLSYKYIGREISILSEIEAGFDWYLDPATRELRFLSQRMTDLSVDTIETNVAPVVLGYGWGPQNVRSVQRTTDPNSLVNHIIVNGKFGSAIVGADRPEPAGLSQNRYGVFEESVTLSDVVDTNILLAFGGAEIIFRATPRVTWEINITPWTRENSSPRIFDDYNIGDKISFIVNSGSIIMDKPQTIRIFGATVSIDDDGNEQVVQLQTNAS